MKSGRRTTDWKAAAEAQPEGDRRADERRSQDRRAPRRAIDPLFAATLVNQIAPAAEIVPPGALSYFGVPSPAARLGRVLNLRA
jgi:hypothetical protein